MMTTQIPTDTPLLSSNSDVHPEVLTDAHGAIIHDAQIPHESAPQLDEKVSRRISEHRLTTVYEDMRRAYNDMVCRAGFIVLRNTPDSADDNPPDTPRSDMISDYRQRSYDILFVNQSRSGFDGFPKGISDPEDDSAIATALRELGEETGITPDKFLEISPVVWAVPRKDFHEVCFFFMCKVSADTPVVVDGQEILSHQWLPLNDIRITQNMAFVTQSMISDIRSIDLESAFAPD